MPRYAERATFYGLPVRLPVTWTPGSKMSFLEFEDGSNLKVKPPTGPRTLNITIAIRKEQVHTIRASNGMDVFTLLEWLAEQTGPVSFPMIQSVAQTGTLGSTTVRTQTSRGERTVPVSHSGATLVTVGRYISFAGTEVVYRAATVTAANIGVLPSLRSVLGSGVRVDPAPNFVGHMTSSPEIAYRRGQPVTKTVSFVERLV